MKTTLKRFCFLGLRLACLGLLAACASPVVSTPVSSPATLTSTTEGSVMTETPLPDGVAAATSTITKTATPVVPSATPTMAYTLYTIQSAPSGLFLTASGGAGVDGSPIDLEPGGSAANQQWRFVPLSGADEGYYYIQSMDGKTCLDIIGGQVFPAGQVGIMQNLCNSGDTQKWKTVPCLTYGPHYACGLASGTVWLQVKQGEETNSWMADMGIPAGGKVMMASCDWKKPGDCTDNGTLIYSISLDGGYDQQWILIAVGP